MEPILTDDELAAIKARHGATTKGPWETREDSDYYQSGTYIGVEPYHYVNGKEVEGRPVNNPQDCYFRHDIARVEGIEAEREFLLHAASLRAFLAPLQAAHERIRDVPPKRLVEAVRWDGRVEAFAPWMSRYGGIPIKLAPLPAITLQLDWTRPSTSDQIVEVGDWIVCDIDGHFTAVKAADFDGRFAHAGVFWPGGMETCVALPERAADAS